MASKKTTESVNFYLKHGTGYANHIIYLQFKFDGYRLRYYLQQPVDPKRWNAKKQRVKDADAKTTDGRHSINDLLNTIAQICIDAYYTEAANGTPTPALLKKHLDAFINQHHEAETIEAARPTLMALVERFISGQIKYKGQSKAANTLKTYTTTKHHLEGYAAKIKTPLDFDSITLDFYYKWVDYLQNKAGLNANAIGKMVQILKVFMSEAVDLGYTTNMAFKHKKFAATRVDSDAVYLSETEIMKLYNFDLSTNKRLEAVRDLFVFGCNVGLRYSDYSNVKPQNIIEVDGQQFIYIRTQKTKDVVYIPCNPVVLDIFNRYQNSPNKLPKTISEQVFNRYIKEAAMAAGMTETGRLLNEPKAALNECITSHTARRSFATNYYLDGFPTMDLMKITGHKTEKAFLRYIKISKLDAAKRMAEHNKKRNWAVLMGGIEQKQLRVAS
jgi:integrase